MKRNYLSIGEFSSLTGKSIKSLRYYDRLNVLKPAYINVDTGYRYYLPEQMIMLDVLKLCMNFDLPLKNLDFTKGKNAPDLKKLISEGQDKARKRLIETQQLLKVSTDILSQIERLDIIRKEKEIYFYDFPKRKFIVDIWDKERDEGKSYVKKIAHLHELAEKSHLTPLTQQGMLIDFYADKTYVFIEVTGENLSENVLSIDSGKFSCMIMKEKDLINIDSILKEKNLSPHYAICLNTDIYDFCLNHNPHMMEVEII